ncbi:MAG TPA: molybdopterin-dependent oxidoreductase, partial [Burkholderiales bacterium]
MAKKQQGGRRKFLARGAALVSGAAMLKGAGAEGLAGEAWERVYGAGFTRYGQPSRFEQAVGRYIAQPYGEMAPGSGSALCPIEALDGIITPTSVHFIRSHSGSPDIDPKLHRLYIHGLVERPLRFSVDALSRYPMTTRIYFIECSGNSLRALTPQPAQVPAGGMHGNVSCNEWTGVPLRVLLEEAGVQPQAKWLLAEGADSAHMSRSVPL